MLCVGRLRSDINGNGVIPIRDDNLGANYPT